MKTSKKKSKDSSLRETYVAAMTSIWFGAPVTDYASCRERFDLQPHAAMCLLIMATEAASSGSAVAMHLNGVFGGGFDRTEAKIVSELGLFSLQSNGYIRLDAKGKKELEEHDRSNYGLGSVQWLLTAKATKLIAPAYCACKGLESSDQEHARKDMVAANKAAVALARKGKNTGAV